MQRGVTRLDDQDLPELLTVKHGSLHETTETLDPVPAIREVFLGIQPKVIERGGIRHLNAVRSRVHPVFRAVKAIKPTSLEGESSLGRVTCNDPAVKPRLYA